MPTVLNPDCSPACAPVAQPIEIRRLVGHGQILLRGGQVRVAGTVETHVALELVGDSLTPFGLDTAVDVEAPLCERRVGHAACARRESASPLGSRSRYSPT